jgi:hypothetical protein
MQLICVWDEPVFEEMLLCGSVPKGQASEFLPREAVNDSCHQGNAGLATAQSSADKKP